MYSYGVPLYMEKFWLTTWLTDWLMNWLTDKLTDPYYCSIDRSELQNSGPKRRYFVHVHLFSCQLLIGSEISEIHSSHALRPSDLAIARWAHPGHICICSKMRSSGQCHPRHSKCHHPCSIDCKLRWPLPCSLVLDVACWYLRSARVSGMVENTRCIFWSVCSMNLWTGDIAGWNVHQ